MRKMDVSVTCFFSPCGKDVTQSLNMDFIYFITLLNQVVNSSI